MGPYFGCWGSLLGPYFKAWGSLLVLVTVQMIESIEKDIPVTEEERTAVGRVPTAQSRKEKKKASLIRPQFVFEINQQFSCKINTSLSAVLSKQTSLAFLKTFQDIEILQLNFQMQRSEFVITHKLISSELLELYRIILQGHDTSFYSVLFLLGMAMQIRIGCLSKICAAYIALYATYVGLCGYLHWRIHPHGHP